MDKELSTLLETMTVERGTRVGHYFIADFTVQDVMERRGKTGLGEKNYIIYNIRRFYPQSVVDAPVGKESEVIHMKIWSK